MLTRHPIIGILTRVNLRDMGYSSLEIQKGMRKLTNDVLKDATETALSMTGTTVDSLPPSIRPEFVGAVADASPPGAFGDGTIIKAITDFLNSPLGQLIIQLIMSLIMA